MDAFATTVFQAFSSKTTRLLAIFSEKEAADFRLWLASPWANTNKKLLPLYERLKNPGAKPLGKEQIFRALYPGRTYDDKMMRNLLASLTKQAEKFLAHQRLRHDADLSKHLLSKVCLERHEPAWHKKLLEELIEKLEGKALKDSEDYLQLAHLHEELHNQTENVHVLGANTGLQMADNYLDSFYSIVKWRYVTELQERQLMLPETYQLAEKIELIELVTKDLNIPVLNIYKFISSNLQTLSIAKYFAMKAEIMATYEYIPEIDKKMLVHYLINSAIRLWLGGHMDIMNELFGLYQKGLADGLLMNHGRLSDRMYANIIVTGNSIGQFEFVAKIIDKYTENLAPNIQEDGKTWAIAHSLQKQKHSEKCIDVLSMHKFGKSIFAVHGKSLLLQAYFDAYRKNTTYYSFIVAYTEAYKKYLHRENSLSIARKTPLLNFIKYTFLLIKNLEEKKQKAKWLKEIKKNVNNEENIQGKQWILEKIAEIENSSY